MSGVDFEELFQSPLDEDVPGSSSGWWVAVAGAATGLAVATLVIAFLGGGDDGKEAVSPTVSAAPPTAAAVDPVPVVADYPPGYEELAPGLGVKPSELIIGDETVAVAFTTAVKRATDPLAPVWPLGGSWRLETPAGTVAESTRVVLGRFSPGSFAVEFPAAPFAGETRFGQATMVARWDHTDISDSITLPFGGEPFVAPEPLLVDITDDVTLTIPLLELGRFLGKVEWRLQGADTAGGRVVIEATLLDVDGNEIGSYSSFPALLDPGQSGTTELTWQEPFPMGQEGAVTVVVDYTVALVEVVVTDVTVDLAATPIGR